MQWSNNGRNRSMRADSNLVKYWSNTGQILVKIGRCGPFAGHKSGSVVVKWVVAIAWRSNGGHRVIIWRSNVGQMLVKCWSNGVPSRRGRGLVKWWSNAGHVLARRVAHTVGVSTQAFDQRSTLVRPVTAGVCRCVLLRTVWSSFCLTSV